MMAANYRHIGGGENRLGRHYSRFSAFWPPQPLPVNHLLCENCRTQGRIGEVGLVPKGAGAPSPRLPRLFRNNSVNASHRKRSTGSGPLKTFALSGARAPRDHGQIGTSLHRTGAMHDVECCDRPAETFQLQVSEVLEPRDRFDRASDAAADQDLPVLGRGAKPGGEVAHRADRGVAGAFGKADLPQGRIALRDAGAKAKLI